MKGGRPYTEHIMRLDRLEMADTVARIVEWNRDAGKRRNRKSLRSRSIKSDMKKFLCAEILQEMRKSKGHSAAAEYITHNWNRWNPRKLSRKRLANFNDWQLESGRRQILHIGEAIALYQQAVKKPPAKKTIQRYIRSLQQFSSKK